MSTLSARISRADLREITSDLWVSQKSLKSSASCRKYSAWKRSPYSTELTGYYKQNRGQINHRGPSSSGFTISTSMSHKVKTLTFNGRRIHIFHDLTASEAKRRAAFRDMRKQLHDIHGARLASASLWGSAPFYWGTLNWPWTDFQYTWQRQWSYGFWWRDLADTANINYLTQQDLKLI